MDLQWGDVPAWAAIVVAVGSGVFSWRARRKAADALRNVDSTAVSMQRIADAVVAMQQGFERARVVRPGDEPRWRLKQSGGSEEWVRVGAPDVTLRPAFTLEFVSGRSYRLRNVGTERASDVTIRAAGLPPDAAARLPAGVDLDLFQSSEPFVLPTTATVTVTCAELADPVTVPLPA